MDEKVYSNRIDDLKRKPENSEGDMVPVFVGIYKKEHNLIEIKEAIDIIKLPKNDEEAEIEEIEVDPLKKPCLKAKKNFFLHAKLN